MAETATPEITLLYADFPGLGARWERDPEGTAEALFRAHDRFAAAVAAHGGEVIPALVDARGARFASAETALAAALAFRRAALLAGDVAVRLALAGGAAGPGGGVPMPVFNRARLLAEGAKAGQVLLAASVVEPARAALPAGAGLLGPCARWLPGLDRLERAFVVHEPGLPWPAGGGAPLNSSPFLRERLRSRWRLRC